MARREKRTGLAGRKRGRNINLDDSPEPPTRRRRQREEEEYGEERNQPYSQPMSEDQPPYTQDMFGDEPMQQEAAETPDEDMPEMDQEKDFYEREKQRAEEARQEESQDPGTPPEFDPERDFYEREKTRAGEARQEESEDAEPPPEFDPERDFFQREKQRAEEAKSDSNKKPRQPRKRPPKKPRKKKSPPREEESEPPEFDQEQDFYRREKERAEEARQSRKKKREEKEPPEYNREKEEYEQYKREAEKAYRVGEKRSRQHRDQPEPEFTEWKKKVPPNERRVRSPEGTRGENIPPPADGVYDAADVPPKDATPLPASRQNWELLQEAINLRLPKLEPLFRSLNTSLFSFKQTTSRIQEISKVYDATNNLYLRVILNLYEYVSGRGEGWKNRPLENDLMYVSIMKSLEDRHMTQESPLVSLGRFNEDMTRYHTNWWKDIAANVINMRSSTFAHFDLVQALSDDLATAVNAYCDEFHPEFTHANPSKQLNIRMDRLNINSEMYRKFKASIDAFRTNWMRKYLFDDWELEFSLSALNKQLRELGELRSKVINLLQTQYDMYRHVLLKNSPFTINYELLGETGEFKSATDFNKQSSISIKARFAVIARIYDREKQELIPNRYRRYKFLQHGRDRVDYKLPSGIGPEATLRSYISFVAVLKEIQQWFAYLHASWAHVWNNTLRPEVEPSIEDLIDEDEGDINEWMEDGQEQEQEAQEEDNDGIGRCDLPLRVNQETYQGDWSKRPLSIEEIREIITENHVLEDGETWEHNQLTPFSEEGLTREWDDATRSQQIYRREAPSLVEHSARIVPSNPVPRVIYLLKVPLRRSTTEDEVRKASKLPYVRSYRKEYVKGWDNQWLKQWTLIVSCSKAPKNHLLSYVSKNYPEGVARSAKRQFIVTISPNRNDAVLSGVVNWTYDSLSDRCSEIMRSLDPLFIKQEFGRDSVSFTLKNITGYSINHQMTEVAPESGKIHWHAVLEIEYLYMQPPDKLFDSSYKPPEIRLDYAYIASLLKQEWGPQVYVNFEVVKRYMDAANDAEDFQRRFAGYIAKQRPDAATGSSERESAASAMAREGLYTGVMQKGSRKVVNKGGARQKRKVTGAF